MTAGRGVESPRRQRVHAPPRPIPWLVSLAEVLEPDDHKERVERARIERGFLS
ncbi:hypothetical protein [Streptomyces sp. NPDC049906]|uniref:hypothetical protein n=1 Tax=Streptomyces sp. NPDC049906 TaxID=3155656 RepID=UPI003432B27D